MVKVDKLLQLWNSVIDELKQHLVKAQLRMKEQANKRHREVEFHIEDMVYLKVRPSKLKTFAKKIKEKLSPRFYGPFHVEERMKVVAYKLLLPKSSPHFSCFPAQTGSSNQPSQSRFAKGIRTAG